MASSKIYTCDVCSVVRQESNHWLLVRDDAAGFLVTAWDKDNANHGEYQHLCGIGCATKLLSSWRKP